MTGTALGLMGLYVFTSVYELEYKFILVSTIVLAPLAAAGIEPLLLRLASWRWIGALILPLVFGSLNMVSLFQHYPEGGLKNLAHAPNVIEESFYLELDSSNENASWVNSVRENTPLNTIVFVRTSPIHLGPFLNRSLYFPGDIDGQSTAGYSVNNQDYLLLQRGYSETIFQERREIVEMLNNNGDFAKLEHIMNKLFDLNRPLAFLFVSPYPPAVKWLEDENLGYKLYEDEKFLLWFVDVPVSSSN
jgi:hypothetical protein